MGFLINSNAINSCETPNSEHLGVFSDKSRIEYAGLSLDTRS